jgi:segregation and condensation protein B
LDQDQQRRIVEAVILASPEPISAARVAELLPRCNPTQVRALVKELNEAYVESRRAFEIWEVAGGYQLRSLPEFASYLKQIQKTRALRLSSAALEVLSVAAYRQPVTRSEIDQIRGVDSGAVLRSLLDRQLVRIAGHREVPGRPIVYATTRRFLEIFGLSRLADLPNLRELEEIGDSDDEAEGTEAAAAPKGEASAAATDAVEKAAPKVTAPPAPAPSSFAPPGGVAH